MCEKKCSNCAMAVLVDFGYSNYTVEGTTVYCSINKHPEGEFDRWYGEDKRDQFAKECDGFTIGDPVDIDCDHGELKYGDDIKKPDTWSEYATDNVSGETLATMFS